MRAALHIITTGDLAVRQVAAMLDLCDASGWRAVSVSRSAQALAALCALGAVDVVVMARRDRATVQTVEVAGGQVAILREPQRPPAAGGPAELSAALAALVAAGRLSRAEAAALMDAAGVPTAGQPDPQRRPRRIA